MTLTTLEVVEAIGGLVESLEEKVRDSERSVPIEELARELLAFRDLARSTSALCHAAEAFLAEVMPKRQMALEGIGLLTRGDSGRRVFPEPDRVAGVVRGIALHDVAVDLETGEIRTLPPEAETAAVKVTDYLMRAARLEFRTGGLRELGVDPDAYSERERGRPTVSIQGAAR